MLDGVPAVWDEINEWLDAARVAHVMEHNRLGVMGHYYGGMLDVYSDLTLQCAVFGGHIELVEVDELAALRGEARPDEIERRVAHFHEAFEIQPDCSQAELQRAARTSVALDELVARHALGSMAYYYQGGRDGANEDAITSIILGASLLTARGIPVAGECEVKNAQAMKIMDTFGAGGSFTEYYATDYNDDVVLMGHDGPGHTAIAEGRTKVRPLGVFHGKVGRGLSVEMSVKHGPVTLLSVVENPGDRLKLLVAEAQSAPGRFSRSEHQQPLRLQHRSPVYSGLNAQGPAHHCAIGVGHIASKILLGAILGMKSSDLLEHTMKLTYSLFLTMAATLCVPAPKNDVQWDKIERVSNHCHVAAAGPPLRRGSAIHDRVFKEPNTAGIACAVPWLPYSGCRGGTGATHAG